MNARCIKLRQRPRWRGNFVAGQFDPERALFRLACLIWISIRDKRVRSGAHASCPARTDFLDSITSFFAGRDVIGGPQRLATITDLTGTNSSLAQDHEGL